MTHHTPASGPWKHPKRAPLILTPEDDNQGERMLGLLLLGIFAAAFTGAGLVLAWVL